MQARRRPIVSPSTMVMIATLSLLTACGEASEDADSSQGAIGVELDANQAAKERAAQKAAKEDAASKEAMGKVALRFPQDTFLTTSNTSGLVASRVVYTGPTPR